MTRQDLRDRAAEIAYYFVELPKLSDHQEAERILSEAVRATLEEAARAVCCECGALGMPDIYDDGDWKHDINGNPSLCDAQDIHDLIAALDAKADAAPTEER